MPCRPIGSSPRCPLRGARRPLRLRRFLPGSRPAVHRLESLRALETTVVCYESPTASSPARGHRSVFGDTEIVVAREMTNQFEEIVRGRADGFRALRSGPVRGVYRRDSGGAEPGYDGQGGFSTARADAARPFGLGRMALTARDARLTAGRRTDVLHEVQRSPRWQFPWQALLSSGSRNAGQSHLGGQRSGPKLLIGASSAPPVY